MEDALLREVGEEKGLPVQIERFLGVVQYDFLRDESSVQFASYVFHLCSEGGRPVIHESEEISEFQAVLPSTLSQIAMDLRSLAGDRRGWGQWRALAHDVVYEYLSS